jgi:hypothetical protein
MSIAYVMTGILERTTQRRNGSPVTFRSKGHRGQPHVRCSGDANSRIDRFIELMPFLLTVGYYALHRQDDL